ncbi:hypothetical protein [Lihuaxuella thermophila]|uniref:CRISPR-associated protein Cst1 n=1 Tax=Lihuaxuella thermophila TaxID=1173111 RepID=A0A1H8D6E1_9BACL|nr:hypothetical protein [Lihuaxuella thermophila]SEN02762.1 hypothetical protein SAMN05444955_1058 [Lihuaxuella thermophila]
MKVRLYHTQDPWMDIGLVAFYEALDHIQENEELMDELALTPGYLSFSLEEDLMEDLQDHLITYLKENLNKVLLPPAELKLLNINDWNKKNERGFLNELYKRTLSKDEIDFLKSKTDDYGQPKQYLSQPQKVVEISCARNFIGLKADWRRMTETYEEEVEGFFKQFFSESPKKKTCPLCGQDADPKSFRPMNQSRNVLFNQHHGTPIRGYASSVSKESMCPTCNLLNLFATLQVKRHPYFVNKHQITHLLVPEVSNLRSLSQLMQTISSNGLEQDLSVNKKIISYRTNINKLKHPTLYVSLLQLYFWMNHIQEESGFIHNPLENQDRSALNGWLIPRYNKGQNVIFKEFTRLSVDEDLFSLTLRIHYNNNLNEGDVVNDFINCIRSEDEQLLDHIAEGIFRKDVRKIARNVYQLYKASLKHPQKYNISIRGSRFFSEYLPYLYKHIEKEDVALFNDQLHEDLRLLGKVIGQHTDLSAMNKLNTAASRDTFIAALKEALFKIYKQQISSQKDQKADEIYNIGTKRMQNILTQLDDKQLLTIRDTLVIYASLAAFQANNLKKKETMEA